MTREGERAPGALAERAAPRRWAILSTSFELADCRCTYLQAGSFEVPASQLFAGSSPEEREAALARHGLPPEQLLFQVRALLVETGSNRVLIDPGGAWEDREALGPALAEEGVAPESVDAVVISHGHADHYWGCVSGGALRFPRARHFIQRSEWSHWLREPNPEPDHAASFRKTLLPLEHRFVLIDGDREIVPGLRSLPLPGHSPGHMGVRIGEAALYTADALLSPVNVERPEWAAGFDIRAPQVVETRRALLRLLAEEGLLVLSCHFPGSGAGRVAAAGAGWRWLPERAPAP